MMALPRPLFRPKDISILIVTAITLLGFGLRMLDYYHLPAFNNAADEPMYEWAGMSLLQTGTPTSWSGIQSYKDAQVETYWGKNYTLVTPWVHKPLVYPLLTGSVALLTGATNFDDVRLTTIRLVPIALSCISIILIYFLTARLWTRNTGYIAALLYATIPTIVISNRISTTESLLTPLILLAFLVATSNITIKWRNALLVTVSIVAILTKQTGIVVPAALWVYYLFKKDVRTVSLITIASIVGIITMVGVGAMYVGLDEYVSLQQHLSDYHDEGTPHLLVTIFKTQTISNNKYLFPDGYILTGLILLLTTPWWLMSKTETQEHPRPIDLFLLFPFLYLLIYILIESGSSRYYAWHIYPLFPFLAILTAVILTRTLQSKNPWHLFGLFILLSPVAAWAMIFFEPYIQWQMLIIAAAIFVTSIALNHKTHTIGLKILFTLLIALNIYTVIKAPDFLLTESQPISTQYNSSGS